MKKSVTFLAVILITAIALAQSCYTTNINAGKSEYNNGNYDKAIEYFETAKKCPDGPGISEANSWIEKCETKKKENCFYTYFNSGKRLYDSKEYTQAIGKFEEAKKCGATGLNKQADVWIMKCNNPPYKKLFSEIENNMVSISGRTFIMGSPKSEKKIWDNETQHTVTVGDFFMSATEVTFDQYDTYCEATGAEKPDDEGWGRGKRPVINVSWEDATAFCEWLSDESGKTYRLPTEAEWEYACRAGTATPFNTGNNLTTSQANYNGIISYNTWRRETIPVGSFAPNNWGLYDMHGNVSEWCSDWYGDYPSSAQTNPQGPSSGSFRVDRGGSWNVFDISCRSASRDFGSPDYRDNDMGFRLVLEP